MRFARRSMPMAIGLAIMAAACTTLSEGTTTSVVTTNAPPSTATPPESTDRPRADVDRIVVVDGEGSVVTMNRDGQERVVLAEDAAADVTYLQPTWSPHGDRVAFSEVAGAFSVVLADETRTDRIPTDTNAFYMYWSPSGNELSLLRSAADGGLRMDIVDVETSVLRNVDDGQPYYYSWSPAGDRLVTHVGMDRLELLDPDGGAVGLPEEPGAYQAPVWTDAGIFHVVRAPVNQRLVLSDPGGGSRPLATVTGSAIFGSTASGDQVAVQVIAGNNDGVSAALQDLPVLPVNRLSVFDLASGDVEAVSDTVVLAFFWSPSGDTLLMLERGAEERTLQWSTWRDGGIVQYDPFAPSVAFVRDFLPFFDQYAQSTSLWAPDGSAFVFPGTIEGRGGIWVQPVEGGAPAFISEGTWAAWSPV